MRKLTVGILAHVDAGKTTLSEAILYTCGAIKKMGRVDNRDSFLDSDTQERKRGITIFSKMARCSYRDLQLTFIDTPGHVDFSGEAERALQILDYAVLVISGTDGAQSHTSTILSLLQQYGIPVFIFITKMDVSKFSTDELLGSLSSSVSETCIDFTNGPDMESVALTDENMLEKYLSEGCLGDADIADLIKKRKVYPCVFGSGLKCENVDVLLDALFRYTLNPVYDSSFSARVFKIAKDSQDKRITFVKLLGGNLSVRNMVGEEKITQIRLYSGYKYETADTVSAGDVCALMGLGSTYAGQMLGREEENIRPVLSPVLTYKVILPKTVDAVSVYPFFKELEEEDPLLNVSWIEKYNEIELQLMGKVQTEVLKSIMLERFGIEVAFDSGRILYKETILDTVEGIGHYEPLKHYAEVHLLIEPLPRGSGLRFESTVPTDDLDLNWQRLILTHLQEKQHIGVLAGCPVTDMSFTLIGGKAHLKHTEGGDFRQATYRAVRNGLMKAESVLLEPFYDFVLSVPSECTGRAISDIHAKSGSHDAPAMQDDFTVLRGSVPAAEISDYASEVQSYTSGRGKLSLTFAGYRPCHNSDEILEQISYDALADTDNPADSVFCSHGAGTVISWDKVSDYCHIPPIKDRSSGSAGSDYVRGGRVGPDIDEAELESIMLREFGPIKRKSYSSPIVNEAPVREKQIKPTRIIVDGYNVIHSWEDLKTVSADSLDLARENLITMLINYHSFTGAEVVLVFDAYLVDSHDERRFDQSGLHIVYTEQGESADSYIEKLVDEIGKNENVKVVSSDSMIQLAAVKTGVIRVSSREFRYDVDKALSELRLLIES